MTHVRCSSSLTLLPPPADDAPRLGAESRRLLRLLSIFCREHPAELCARLLRDEARRVLRLPPSTDTPRAKRGPGRSCLWVTSRGPPG